MATKKRSVVFGVGALALVASGAAGSWQMLSAGTASGAPRPAAPRAEEAPPPRPAAARRQWKAGSSFVYAIDSARSITAEPAAGGGRTLGTTLSGKLALTVVEATPTAVRLRAELRAPQHRETDARELPLDGAALARAFYLTARADGRMESFSFQRGVTGLERGTLEGLVTTLQVVTPGPAAAWQSTEQDTSGEYLASYKREGDAIHKSKERYLRTVGPRGLIPVRDPARYTVSSSIDFALDPTGWPRTVGEDETIRVDAGAMRIVTRSRTTAKLIAVEEAHDLAALVAAETGALVPAGDADAEGFAEAKRQADQSLVAGASYRTLLDDLRAADVHVKNRGIGRAAALFRLAPAEAARAADSILHGDLEEDAQSRLIGALGGAGTKEAQRALASILDSKNASPAARDDAAAALGMSNNPTVESEEALRKAMASDDPQVSSTATLGEGNLIRRMNEGGTGDPATAIDALIHRLEAATSDDERKLCLDALGNSGDPRALAASAPYLQAPAVMVRKAAVFALRFMRGDEVDGALSAALGDPEVEVRRAAVGTLSFRSITPILPAVEHLLETEGDVGVRVALVTAMQIRKVDDPAVMDLLGWAAAHDPAEEVRSAAKKALGGS